MEIKLHYLPEKPGHSCDVLAFHRSELKNSIYNVTNCEYSDKYGLFNCYDWMTDVDRLKKADIFGKTIIAWAYMDEVERGVLNETDR